MRRDTAAQALSVVDRLDAEASLKVRCQSQNKMDGVWGRRVKHAQA
jgi:hypothetical protein